MLTIFKTTMNHADEHIVVQFRETVPSLQGPTTTIDGYVVLSEADAPLNDPKWSNADMIAAVAKHYGIAESEVAIEAVRRMALPVVEAVPAVEVVDSVAAEEGQG